MERSDKQLAESIKSNSHTLYILSVEQLTSLHQDTTPTDKANIARSSADYVSSMLDIKTCIKMVRDLGAKGRVYEKVIDGKQYIIFKGHPGLRTIFTGTKYLASNAKVVDMVIGKAAVKNSARLGGRLTIFLTVPLIILEHILKDEFLLSDLVADLAVSIVKVGVSSILAAVIATAVGTATTIAAAPLAVAIFVGLASGYTLNKIDDRFSITIKLGQVLRDIEDNTIGAFSRGMWELEKTLRWQIVNGISPGKGIFYP
ncbi:hypothetical protein CYL31_03270 [Marinomonas sp. A3A]|uniref:hypothetical protein n=1 Tax=Marinomonas sp. A3A TaxID=2065312 RepID=UPI001BB3A5C2|nr:hypothetical protein [Marinomonas sp. A3A]QUX90479.1 hypothetical protein CYL31_03270 [Marinomonas sp. A3A]